MVDFRRLLTGLLVFAVTQFGAVATAPAHAHEDDGRHGVREIVLVHHAAEEVAHHHDDGDHHAGHADAAADATAAAGSNDSGTDDASHGEHAHVHACPQFAPLGGHFAFTARVMQLEMMWPARASQAVSHLSSPPLRPPRLTL